MSRHAALMVALAAFASSAMAQDIAGTFDPTKVTRTVVGSATLTFTGGKLQASLTVDGQTTNKTLQRQSF